MLVGRPGRNDAPEVHLTIPDLAENDLDLAAFEDGDDAPIPNRLTLPHPLLARFDLEFLDGLLELLKRVGVGDEPHGSRQELEPHHLGRPLPFAAGTFEDDVVEAFGGEVHSVVKRRRMYRPRLAVQAARILANFFVVRNVLHAAHE